MKLKELFKAFGIANIIACTALFYHAFLMAYISPTKRVTINIDSVGEANLELFLLLVFLPMSILVVYRWFKD